MGQPGHGAWAALEEQDPAPGWVGVSEGRRASGRGAGSSDSAGRGCGMLGEQEGLRDPGAAVELAGAKPVAGE